ncbi:sigma-70 family RNA polymerase sigma factor [Lacrimispora amygdalina]|uniref:Sigma-70 family RNA polymerase sigma factor n=1 Tax=Lacrimispora amygdalina TaxID=253257 RepID=A0A3E2N9E2_9FIRM|nr:sigma-70 family RNA polymerase sigma factor [Clostridium indicum]RFZ77606.1 sigma-70 family RNA polymerase sigma factor [Clostridium indicum]
MLYEGPLNAIQRDFAAEHHALVYKFLNNNRLPEDEFYDVVIFAYLKAVRDYFTDPTAQKYSFTTIANRRMRFCLYDYFRSQARKKRNVEVFSIHIGLGPNSYPLEETIVGQDDLMQQLETDLLLHELASKVSKQQMDMVRLKTHGYNLREISRHQKTPMNRVKELLEEVHTILLELCYES